MSSWTFLGFPVYRWPYLCHMGPAGCLQDRHPGQGLLRLVRLGLGFGPTLQVLGASCGLSQASPDPRGCSHLWRGPTWPISQHPLSSWPSAAGGGGDRKAGWKEGQIAFPLGQRGPPGGFTGEDR